MQLEEIAELVNRVYRRALLESEPGLLALSDYRETLRVEVAERVLSRLRAQGELAGQR